MTNLYIDIHILHSVPPSNLNRDDTGSPKSAYYGGVQRARVSSQAWKKATRSAFGTLLDKSQLGTRTKRVVAHLAQTINAKAPDLPDANALAAQALTAAGIKVTAPRLGKNASEKVTEDAVAEAEQAGYLVFLSATQIERLADLAIEAHHTGDKIDPKAARRAADENNSVDVALFGRMVADATDLNVDAAAQVAHALSVHAVQNEFDYFTAVDDRKPDDTSGAGMIGTVEFNSSTLYRYATLNVEGLHTNLADPAATVQAVRAFLKAFITSMPTGKQNTFANRTLPDAIVVTLRTDQPINLVGAFEDAVEASTTQTRLQVASTRLAEHATAINTAYGDGGATTFVVHVGSHTAALAEIGQVVTLDQLIDAAADAVDAHLSVPA